MRQMFIITINGAPYACVGLYNNDMINLFEKKEDAQRYIDGDYILKTKAKVKRINVSSTKDERDWDNECSGICGV